MAYQKKKLTAAAKRGERKGKVAPPTNPVTSLGVPTHATPSGRKVRKDYGTVRELTAIAERLATLAREVANMSRYYGGKMMMAGEKSPINDTEIVMELKDIEYTIRSYDQRDRLKEDKQ